VVIVVLVVLLWIGRQTAAHSGEQTQRLTTTPCPPGIDL